MQKTLDEIAEVFTGARVSRFNKENAELKPVFLRPSALSHENKLNYSLDRISNELNKKYYSKKEDILILLANPESIIKVDTEGIIIPMDFAVIRVKREYNPQFIYHLLKNKIITREIPRLVEGSVLRVIKTHNLKEIKIPIVEKEKQDKCANLLKLIDKRIKLNKELIKLDENIEKVILNKILGEN